MIHFKSVSKVFKTDLLSQSFRALDDVTFSIPEGAMVGFLGANGAGKTTSLKIIMDFIRPTSGEVQFSSRLGSNRMEVLKNIGFLPERPYFYPHLTGEDFLRYMGSLSEMPAPMIRDEVRAWAPRFRMEHALGRQLKTYSKGMLQRIGFMASIIHRPKLIILDEPLSGLDPVGRKELKDVIIDLHKAGQTVFFSSHIVPDIEEICDRVIFLKEGRLVYEGLVENILDSDKSLSYSITVGNVDPNQLSTPALEVVRLPGNLLRIKVDPVHKDRLLSELLERKGGVQSLDRQKPTLEEIFYQTQGKS